MGISNESPSAQSSPPIPTDCLGAALGVGCKFCTKYALGVLQEL